MTPLPLHATIEGYGVANDELTVDGRTLRDLARQAGQTPFYVYSRQLIDERLRRLRSILPPGIHLHYAIKANPMPELVRLHRARGSTAWMWHRPANWPWPCPPAHRRS